jgi:hypothetical protein
MTTAMPPSASNRLQEWLLDSLAQGTVLASAVSALLGQAVVRIVLAGQTTALQVLPAHGSSVPTSESDQLAAAVLEIELRNGGRTLIVEDDLARKGDRVLTQDRVGFVDDRVLRWADLESEDAPGLLRTGSAGYPLNAYVVSLSADELGLTNGLQLGTELVQRIAESTMLVLVGAFDGEGFIAAWPSGYGAPAEGEL